MTKFNLVKTSKSGQLEVYDYTGKINQRDAKKAINRFRRQIKKQNPDARIGVSFKVKNNDAIQNDGYFWNSIAMRNIDFDVDLPSQYGGRIQEISLMITRN